jgi:hypothetical protein
MVVSQCALGARKAHHTQVTKGGMSANKSKQQTSSYALLDMLLDPRSIMRATGQGLHVDGSEMVKRTAWDSQHHHF